MNNKEINNKDLIQIELPKTIVKPVAMRNVSSGRLRTYNRVYSHNPGPLSASSGSKQYTEYFRAFNEPGKKTQWEPSFSGKMMQNQTASQQMISVSYPQSVLKDFPHSCPRCKAPAYIGFSSIECFKKCH